MQCQFVVILHTVVLDLRPAMPQKVSRGHLTHQGSLYSLPWGTSSSIFFNYGKFDCIMITVIVRLLRQKYLRMMYNT